MFTIEQIKAAHAQVKSGADFPQYIQDLIVLGVSHYTAYVADGHTVYSDNTGQQAIAPARYEYLSIAQVSDLAEFQTRLKAHQNGQTDYPTFCKDCAITGIEKWIIDMDKMTCTYYNLAGEALLVEVIPTV